MIPTTSLEQHIGKISEPWSPVTLARVNDQVVRLALFKGEYHWHRHTDEDELFYVCRGNIVIQLRDQPDIELREGEMAVVPKGVEHCPKAEDSAHVLMFEPASLQSRGD
jgi:quercetin dioxygenase-like cupin family protein